MQQSIIGDVASRLFLTKGFENVTLMEIANEAATHADEVYKFFGSKEDIILFLYQRINADWEIFTASLNEKKLSDRFAKALLKKIELVEPYTPLLSGMMGTLIKSASLGVQSPRTRHIRSKGLRIMRQLIDGSNSRLLKSKAKNLPALLYLIHWGILFLHIQRQDLKKTREIIQISAKILKRGDRFWALLPILPFVGDITHLSELLLEEGTNESELKGRDILGVVFNHRKISQLDIDCSGTNCETCIERHLSKIDYFVSINQPVHFILPAFPAKSPNQSKVLGELPDLGEEAALLSLESMCREIADTYPPGARVTICSDGRIFAELVGVMDEQVTAYGDALQKMITDLGLKYVDIIRLEDLLPAVSFAEARKFILGKYAEATDDLYGKLKTSEEFKRLFNGIHRFISDDRMGLDPAKSKNRVKEESKAIALEVIQRSNAWTRYLAYFFPESIRLSIHPYGSHAEKIGIKLTKAADNWLTPWHGVMVLTRDGYMLMKKQEAEKLNARLVFKNGRPYYFTQAEVE